MTSQIRFTPDPGQMGGTLTDVPAFPGESFDLNPEAIGDASSVCRNADLELEWSEVRDGVWSCAGHCTGELAYKLTITPGHDTVDIEVVATNKSKRFWAQSLVFNHFGCRTSPSVADHECVRHWCMTGGEFKHLTEVPRRFGPRPTVQVYRVEGAPPVSEVPFAAAFAATPDVVLEDWLAIQARDGERLAAVVSKPALFLFQNMELSCIHSGMSFGALQPGASGRAQARLYLVQSSLTDWYARMRTELGA